MPKTIIALRGKGNVGKSQTIKSVYEKLIASFPNAKLDGLLLGVDVRAIITINGIKIGIESQGDPNSRLFESIKWFIESECTIIICATRSRGGTVKLIEAQKSIYSILWYEQIVVNKMGSWKESNLTMSHLVMDKIMHLINA